MMYGELYHYFSTYRQLNVPGIGTFSLKRQPAAADFINKQILPPSFIAALEPENTAVSKHLISWLAASLGITEREAVIRFNDFAFDLRRKLDAGEKIDWAGMGTLKTGLGAAIKFEPALKESAFDKPVAAVKVVRSQAEHTVRVGEQEKTAAEMREYFSQPDAGKNYWWAWALIAGFAALIFCGWYFSANGISVSSTGNTNSINATEASSTYRHIR